MCTRAKYPRRHRELRQRNARWQLEGHGLPRGQDVARDAYLDQVDGLALCHLLELGEGTGIAAHYYGAKAAEGFFHTFSGWLVFIVAFAMLFGVTKLILRVVPRRHPAEPSAVMMARGQA